MARMDAGKLRDQAAGAVAKGRHKKALEAYLQLEEIEPLEGGWSRRAGEMHRQLRNESAAIEAFARAARRYAAQGFLLKAVAACKIILRIEPSNEEAHALLIGFNTERGFAPLEDAGAGASTPTQAARAQPTPVPELAKEGARPTHPGLMLDLDAPIESLSLHDEVRGSVERQVGSLPSGVFEIALESEDDDDDLLIDLGDSSDDIKRAALAQTPLFSALSPASLGRLLDKVQLIELPAGQLLFRQGDHGTGLFVVVEGRVAVKTEGANAAVLGELKDGDFFGEIAVVTNQPRTASVQALTDTDLLCVERHHLRELISEEPEVLPVLLRFLRERLVGNLVRTSKLFAPFQDAGGAELIKRFSFLEVDAGTTLVRQGQVSPALYIAMSGAFSVDRHQGEQVQHLADLGAGDVFGEMSLLANSGAVASVQATGKCLVLELAGKPFREIIMTHPHVLEFVGSLAADREASLAKVAGGQESYEELHLDLF